MFYKVSFRFADNTFCTNICDAQTFSDLEREYSDYNELDIREAQPWEVEDARQKGMPIIKARHLEPVPEALEEARAAIAAKPGRSAWDRGVNVYALELLDDLEDAICGGWFDAEDLDAPELVRKALLNGADDWSAYSWGGSALIYDGDIAERLCCPSELKKTRNGERRPNSREEWLDTQARALYQAARRVENAISAAVKAHKENTGAESAAA